LHRMHPERECMIVSITVVVCTVRHVQQTPVSLFSQPFCVFLKVSLAVLRVSEIEPGDGYSPAE